jgi:transglutaminase-like putative cysteine protease
MGCDELRSDAFSSTATNATLAKADSPTMKDSVLRYSITHRTHYEYSSESSLCHNQLHLRPRELPRQKVSRTVIEIEPRPASRFEWYDAFGNAVEFFSIEQIHSSLTVLSRSEVELTHTPPPPLGRLTWGELMRHASAPAERDSIAAQEFVYDSRYCHAHAKFAQFLEGIIEPSRDVVECLLMLNRKMNHEFQYVPESTHVTTRPLDALEKRKGVCQDFAHILISCMRSVGVPARYVSGYLLTQPPPGEPRLVGADASHAWASVYAGPLGWIDLDPTNNVIPSTEHITVAWGRDYSDVAPIAGVFVGGGCTTLTVAVDVLPSDAAPSVDFDLPRMEPPSE